ncbi:HlyIII-domain-containing protein [Suhomyces tanzawaensis NRRL Y-17324]|uniref:HlyIII-domain-containing protein n=1 Tax=Suhomyces tanzawaensis NRRL Y-17324 TaxID=984487 RepID=A0A1E4SN77_9ASCO|nr:HlyIII-domain-containing protein [Suhomyces tanzawaensis NRRL Y-17324]ODV80938.1 HlyIII-domain-containing protein [Suhomyces tanzawaensis NRRL Y-17324]
MRNRNSRSTYVDLAQEPNPEASATSTLPFRLHFYHELDDWQKDNHYIKSGYVRETSSLRKCLESLLYLHNETVNIYSHLIPSSFLLAAVIWYINHRLPIYDNYLGVWEKLNFVQFGVACTLCLFMSSTFHCIKSHSHKVSRIGNQLDYFGIVILITCSLISIILFAFYDQPFYRGLFVLLFLTFGTACTVLTLHPKFATPLYRPYRSLMFILFGLSGIFPVIAATKLYGFEPAAERANVTWLALEGFFYIFGAVLYAARIPERFSHTEEDEQSLLNNPSAGRWDIFGASHQIFHVMVVIAAYCHWKALLGCYHYLHLVTLHA